MGAEVGSLPGLGAFSHMGGSAFGATAHAAVHDAFMTLPPYIRSREGGENKVHELGCGVRNCSHTARSRPVEASSESIERAGEGTSAEGQLVAHPVGGSASRVLTGATITSLPSRHGSPASHPERPLPQY